MAEKAHTRHERERAAERGPDLVPDLYGVASRVSWSAIIAGTVVAFACMLALTLFFGALGITLTDQNVREGAVQTGTLIAMVASVIVSLFLGGWVAAQMTVGENRQEAILYGVLTWGAAMLVSIAMVGMSVQVGVLAGVGGSLVVQNNERIPSWETLALQSGTVSQAQINEWKARSDPEAVRAAAADPANRARARENAMYSAWIALVCTLLSMAACIGGSMLGRGVAFHLYPWRVTREDRIVVPANP
jgi:ABC-type transport system involved in multi-copper enzyme maturation permease subunit